MTKRPTTLRYETALQWFADLLKRPDVALVAHMQQIDTDAISKHVDAQAAEIAELRKERDEARAALEPAKNYINDVWAPHIKRCHYNTEKFGKFLTVKDAFYAGQLSREEELCLLRARCERMIEPCAGCRESPVSLNGAMPGAEYWCNCAGHKQEGVPFADWNAAQRKARGEI